MSRFTVAAVLIVLNCCSTPAADPPKWDAFYHQTVGGLKLGDGTYRIDRKKQGNKLTDEQSRLVDHMRNAAGEYQKLRDKGSHKEAIAPLQRIIAINRELFGESASTSFGLLPSLANVYEDADDLPAAIAVLEAVVRDGPKLFGPKDQWQVTDARLRLARCRAVLAFPPDRRDKYRELTRLQADNKLLMAAGRYRDALAQARRAEGLAKDLFGPDSAEYAVALNNLAATLQDMEDYREAEPLLRRSLEVQGKILGEVHPHYTTAVSNLATLYKSMGRLADAEVQARKANELFRKREGEDTADVQNWFLLAGIYSAMGDTRRAEEVLKRIQKENQRVRQLGLADPENEALAASNLGGIYLDEGDLAAALAWKRAAVEGLARVFGEAHPAFAKGVNGLGTVFEALGDHARAEQAFTIAADIIKAALGEGHPDCALFRLNLARVYEALERFGEAEAIHLKVLEVFRRAYGPDHHRTASAAEALGVLYIRIGKLDEAQKHLTTAREVMEKGSNRRSDDYAILLNQIANLHLRRKELDAAERTVTEALEVLRAVRSKDHFHNALMLTNLAAVKRERGDSAAARDLLRQALEVRERFLRETFNAQADRQRLTLLATMRPTLDGYLSLSPTAAPGEAYTHVLFWKGAVASRLASDIILSDHPKLRAGVEKLNELRARYARLAFATPPPGEQEAWEKQLTALRNQKEDLEGELAAQGVELRKGKYAPDLSLAELTAALPTDSVLIDVLEYQARGADGKVAPRITAFVVRKGHPLRQVDLGPAQPVAAAVEMWRKAAQEGDGPTLGHAGDQLAKLVWAPIKAHVGEAKTVFVAPDGVLCRVPFAALPGAKPGSYLLEERAFVSVTSARQIRDFGAAPGAGAGLLAIGGVSYEPPAKGPIAGPPGLPRPPAGAFGPLPGSEIEVDAVAGRFRKAFADRPATVLRGGDTTEARVKAELARGPAVVHFATHGFFAPPDVVSLLRSGQAPANATPTPRVAGYSPFLLSGLVLARPAPGPQAPVEDGYLTAEELNGMNLRGTELVVLSACETGLGETAGGEAVLGLQRAFHSAGARTVVASLWKVDDAATSLLMEEFYGNLWEKKLPPAEALRRAQLAVLASPDRVADRRKSLAAEVAKRGLKLGAEKELPDGGKIQGRTHPALWAAFVMSGAPR